MSLNIERTGTDELPSQVILKYIDPERALQTGAQSAIRSQVVNSKPRTIEFPIILTATEAAQIADILLSVQWNERNTCSFRLPIKYIDLVPSDVIRINTAQGEHTIRLTKVVFDKQWLDCSGVTVGVYSSTAEGQSNPTQPEDVGESGPTDLVVIDTLPLLIEHVSIAPTVYLAASGFLPTWRGCIVNKKPSNIVDWSYASSISSPSVMGTIQNAIGNNFNGQPTYDASSSFNVTVYGELDSRQINEILANKTINSCAVGNNTVGWEVMQFTTATLVEANTYRIEGLIRGNTAKVSSHAVGELFVLLDQSKIKPTSVDGINKEYDFEGVSVGDTIDSGDVEKITPKVATVAPPTPINVFLIRSGGDTHIRWGRRSYYASGLTYLTNADRVVVDVYSATTYIKSYTFPTETSWVYTAAQKTADGATGTLNYRIKCVNDYGTSELITRSEI